MSAIENLKNMTLPPASQTGRFFVYSTILNKTFCIEPIDNHPDNLYRSWGDVNPATKKLEGDYGDKYVGGIEDKDSIITKENGFNKIQYLSPGTSPTGYIQMLEQQHIIKNKK